MSYLAIKSTITSADNIPTLQLLHHLRELCQKQRENIFQTIAPSSRAVYVRSRRITFRVLEFDYVCREQH